MAETTRTVLPLKDIQVALESRIEMLKGIRKNIAKASGASTAKTTKSFNAAELKRADKKLKQLQKALDALNSACCPTPMDCPHDFKTD
jgi:hypothetical protein